MDNDNSISDADLNITYQTLLKINKIIISNTPSLATNNKTKKIINLLISSSKYKDWNNFLLSDTNNSANIAKDTSDKILVSDTRKRTIGRCYICGRNIKHNDSTSTHSFYKQLCLACGELNYCKRDVIGDLKGTVAIVTGGRVKIGYYTARQLLRSGATVIVTTRFANDCLSRFSKEDDWLCWKDRLEIYQVDFLRFYQLKAFIRDVKSKYAHIDILINNAAQTIKRPSCFYENLEEAPRVEDKSGNIKGLYGNFFLTNNVGSKRIMDNNDDDDRCNKIQCIGNEDQEIDYSMESVREIYFPKNQIDEHSQQIDLRPMNNWIQTIQEVKPEECAELFTINAIAPFHLIGELWEHMKRNDNTKHSWIINVSSMEGSFNRKNKTAYHPHNNMAKASLNMITRTNANLYFKDYIVMLSVDTGWNTIEEPCSYHIKSPIDCIDGMARILDPIFSNLTKPGLFYKNFRPTSW